MEDIEIIDDLDLVSQTDGDDDGDDDDGRDDEEDSSSWDDDEMSEYDEDELDGWIEQLDDSEDSNDEVQSRRRPRDPLLL